jgi:PAS domain S-box-containing protein
MTGTELLELLPVAVYMTDAEGRITFYNDAAAELWGHRPELGSHQWCGSGRLYWPDGRPLAHDQCPMAIALKEGRPVRGVEAIAERPDGTRVHFAPYPTPLRDAAGRLVGAINLLMDVTDRAASAIDTARLAAIVSSSDDAIVSKTLDGIITSWNQGAARIFGYEPGEIIGQPITRIIPPELHAEEKQIIARLQRGERIDHYETVRVAKDGRRIDISLTVSPLRDPSGRIVGASKVARDVSERKQAERLQRILIDELNHRVKNTLATVQAIANQSLVHAKSPADFAASFSARVRALASAHMVLTRSEMRGAEIMDLVREQVLLDVADDPRISCSGPLLMLEPQAALHLALVLHELATNARKHGALSAPSGRLSVTWEVRRNGGQNLLLHWKESAGPAVRAPAERGFGSTLIEQTLRVHGGETSVHYGPDGVICEIRLPLPQETRSRSDIGGAPPSRTRAASVLGTHGDEPDLAGKRILVIEDEPLVAMDLESSLQSAGCQVIGPAGTVAQAMSLVVAADYDAALVDVNLAGHPVDEIAAALAQKNRPFAFVTGYGREALPRGFRDAVVLNKPFSQEQLLTSLEVLLYQAAGVVRLRQKRL